MLTIEFAVVAAKEKSLLHPLDERFISFIGSRETVDAIFNAIKFTEPLCKNTLSANKLITVSILEPINPGMNSEDFTELIENKIYSELQLIS